MSQQDGETGYRLLPLADIRESASNPRTTFDAAALDELRASIQDRGVLVPLLVRPVNGHFEVIDGARRFRAAQAAGLAVVPTIVRAYDDDAAAETAIVTNLQRADVHPLDEAAGYAALMARDAAYTVEAVAARVGKSAAYVRGRLRLNNLVASARHAYLVEHLTAAHAALIAPLTPDLQEEALVECFDGLDYEGTDRYDPKSLISVGRLREWIQEQTSLAVADLGQPDMAALFPEAAAVFESSAITGEPPLAVAQGFSDVPKALLETGVLKSTQWRPVEDGSCDHARKAIVVHGYDKGDVLTICQKASKCALHWSESPAKTGGASTQRTDYQAEAKARDEKWKAWGALKAKALEAVLAKVRGTKTTDAHLEMAIERRMHGPEVDSLRKAIGGVTFQTFATYVLMLDIIDHAWSRENFEDAAKTYRIDLKALEAGNGAPQAAPAKKGTPRKGDGNRGVTAKTSRRPVAVARTTKASTPAKKGKKR